MIKLPKLPNPKDLAEDICRVQPMPSDIFSKLIKAATPKSKLIEDGYEPVSSIGLMWVKKDKNERATRS